jgi:hypothetical protein
VIISETAGNERAILCDYNKKARTNYVHSSVPGKKFGGQFQSVISLAYT